MTDPSISILFDGDETFVDVGRFAEEVRSLVLADHEELVFDPSDTTSVLYVLRCGSRAWLMWMDGDESDSTRNPKIDSDEKLPFRLSNGQLDHYPLAWTYSLPEIHAALIEFAETLDRPTCVEWAEP